MNHLLNLRKIVFFFAGLSFNSAQADLSCPQSFVGSNEVKISGLKLANPIPKGEDIFADSWDGVEFYPGLRALQQRDRFISVKGNKVELEIISPTGSTEFAQALRGSDPNKILFTDSTPQFNWISIYSLVKKSFVLRSLTIELNDTVAFRAADFLIVEGKKDEKQMVTHLKPGFRISPKAKYLSIAVLNKNNKLSFKKIDISEHLTLGRSDLSVIQNGQNAFIFNSEFNLFQAVDLLSSAQPKIDYSFVGNVQAVNKTESGYTIVGDHGVSFLNAKFEIDAYHLHEFLANHKSDVLGNRAANLLGLDLVKPQIIVYDKEGSMQIIDLPLQQRRSNRERQVLLASDNRLIFKAEDELIIYKGDGEIVSRIALTDKEKQEGLLIRLEPNRFMIYVSGGKYRVINL
ncbi:MAG: hypothetical protein SGJ18_11610 [Pseudomonadota bacterium]|nr:hypothetical protein [Pseudomonadota bacterium]